MFEEGDCGLTKSELLSYKAEYRVLLEKFSNGHEMSEEQIRTLYNLSDLMKMVGEEELYDTASSTMSILKLTYKYL